MTLVYVLSVGVGAHAAVAVIARLVGLRLAPEVRSGSPHTAALCLIAIRRLILDTRVPVPMKAVMVGTVGWVILPTGRLPRSLSREIDRRDLVLLNLAVRFVAGRLPDEVMLDAWPDAPAQLARLIGTSRHRQARRRTLRRLPRPSRYGGSGIAVRA